MEQTIIDKMYDALKEIEESWAGNGEMSSAVDTVLLALCAVDAEKELMTQQAPSDASAERLRRQFHDEYKTVRYMLTPLCNALEVSNTCDDPRTEENPENRALACGRYQLHPSNTLTNSPSDIAPQDAIDLYLAEQGIYGLLLEAIAKIVEETWDVDIRAVEVNWGGMGSRSEDVRAAVFEAKYGLPWY
tara:strand:- start:13228 stop:13794 length:567 start_codon:yes stop_codon:yes gene_type:complete